MPIETYYPSQPSNYVPSNLVPLPIINSSGFAKIDNVPLRIYNSSAPPINEMPLEFQTLASPMIPCQSCIGASAPMVAPNDYNFYSQPIETIVDYGYPQMMDSVAWPPSGEIEATLLIPGEVTSHPLGDTTPSPSDTHLNGPADRQPTPANVADAETVSKKELAALNQKLADAIDRARTAEQRAFSSEKAATAVQTAAQKQVDELQAQVDQMQTKLAAAEQKSQVMKQRMKDLAHQVDLAKNELQQSQTATKKLIELQADRAARDLETLKNAELEQAKAEAERAIALKAMAEKAEAEKAIAEQAEAEKVAEAARAKKSESAKPETQRETLEQKLKMTSDKIKSRRDKQRQRLLDSGAAESSKEIKALDKKFELQLKNNEAKIRSEFENKNKQPEKK